MAISQQTTPSTSALVSVPFWGLVLLSAGFFVASQIAYSAAKPLWLDEVYGLQHSVRAAGFLELFISGAAGQGSPAPLDYLLLKVLDAIRFKVGYFNLPPHAYFRLVSLAACVAAGLFMAGVAMRQLQEKPADRILQQLLVYVALLLFWFNAWPYRYAAEMRPYGLWNSLWLVAMCLFFLKVVPKKWLMCTLVLLALSSVAAIYQISSLALACGLRELWSGRRCAEIFREWGAVFLLPAGVCLYYVFQIGEWTYTGAEWGDFDSFVDFYLKQFRTFFYCACSVLLLSFHQHTRRLVTPSLGMCLLFLLGPLIFWLTRSKGFFFSERQFIYYSTAAPIFFVSLAVSLPSWKLAFKRPIGAMAVWGVSLFLVLGFFAEGLYDDLQGALGKLSDRPAWSIPVDPMGAFAGLVRNELPGGFCLEGTSEEVSRFNLKLIAEWLPRYLHALPKGSQVVRVGINGDKNLEVLSVGGEQCPSGVFVKTGESSSATRP